MASNIHGFRAFSFARCMRTGFPVLQGMASMHLHNRVQKAAECLGISPAMWMTQAAQEHLATRTAGGPDVPHEGPAPDWDCSCFVAGTRVLVGDYTWRPIETLREGDIVIGFDREPNREERKHAHRLIRPTRVTKTFQREAEVVALKVSTGRTVYTTPDHKILTRKRLGHNHEWKEVQELNPGDEIVCPFPRLWTPEMSWEAGWLSGIYDGEGCVDSTGQLGARIGPGRIVVAQNPGLVLDRMRAMLRRYDFDYSDSAQVHNTVRRLRLRGGIGEAFRFMGTIRPLRLLTRWQGAKALASLQGKGHTFVESVQPCYRPEMVYNIQTESGAYFAEGLAVSNCGSYFYRTLKDAWTSPANVYAHVTCLERTILHKNGGRTTQYAVDYLLAPSEPNQKVYLPVESPAQAQGQVIPIPTMVGAPWGGLYGGITMGEAREYDQVLDEVAITLGVPILEKDDLRGCPECLIVNSWREPKEITDQMRRDWFGEGYK